MDNTDPTEAKERHLWLCRVVEQALQFSGPERSAYLAEVCEHDDERRRVDELLALDLSRTTSGDVFARLDALGEAKPDGPRASSLAVGSEIGPYRLVEVLGEGGMGVVYLAEQERPVKRRVALKLMGTSLGRGESAMLRFAAERQAMARLSHPGIAQIFEAGATSGGFPYFAMEYVPGPPMTRYCDREQLTLEERLRLFLDVCRAVEHAHQRGILHRDLKPSNLLVAEVDGRPHPKVIDFGIAKALDRPLTDRTGLTADGWVGTPSYMSPESLSGEGGGAVDTRSDLYALGVLLFELVVGVRPFARAGSSVAQWLKRMTEEDAPRMSTRFFALSQEEQEAIAARRLVPVATLAKTLDGDLDWIVDKALRKDREERYASVAALAADVERFLADEPVEARAPSAAYLARKLAKKYRAAAAVSALGLLLLVAFAVTLTIQNRQISSALESARQEAEARGFVSEFLKELFTASTPARARGETLTARELLDEGAEKIEGVLEERPEIRAELRLTIGETYTRLGLYDEAEPLVERALAELRETLGEENEQTLDALGVLADLYQSQGRFDEAETFYREGLEKERRVSGAGKRILRWGYNLGRLYVAQYRFGEAEALLVEALGTAKQELGDDDPWTLAVAGSLGVTYLQLGRLDEAEPLFLQNLEMQRQKLGDDDPSTLTAANSLAYLYGELGRFQEAEALYLDGLSRKRRILGDEHPSTLMGLKNLGLIYTKTGRPEEAEALFREALEGYRRALGDDYPLTFTTTANLAEALAVQGRLDEAEPLYRRALAGRLRTFGESNVATLRSTAELGDFLRRRGRFEEARDLLEGALAGRLRELGEDAPDVGDSYHRLGCLASAEGKDEEASEHFRRAAAIGGDVFPDCEYS